MYKYTANSVEAFITIFNGLSRTESDLWFRGQPSAEYQLVPNLLRYKNKIMPENEDEKLLAKYTKSIEYVIPSFEIALSEFKRKAHGFIDHSPKNDFEWMFIMQHYGMLTKLLDWSTNALVGLYFAIPEINDNGTYTITDEEEHESIERFNDTGYS
jgi:FRG domain